MPEPARRVLAHWPKLGASMQILLNTEPHTAGRASLSAYLDAAVTEALAHHGARLIRVDAHLSDANSSAKVDTDEIHCTLEAQVAGLDPVVVKDRAATPRQAIHGALARLERAIDHAIDRHAPNRTKLSKEDPLIDVEQDHVGSDR